jgi:hypothetical protein
MVILLLRNEKMELRIVKKWSSPISCCHSLVSSVLKVSRHWIRYMRQGPGISGYFNLNMNERWVSDDSGEILHSGYWLRPTFSLDKTVNCQSQQPMETKGPTVWRGQRDGEGRGTKANGSVCWGVFLWGPPVEPAAAMVASLSQNMWRPTSHYITLHINPKQEGNSYRLPIGAQVGHL